MKFGLGFVVDTLREYRFVNNVINAGVEFESELAFCIVLDYVSVELLNMKAEDVRYKATPGRMEKVRKALDLLSVSKYAENYELRLQICYESYSELLEKDKQLV